MKTLAQLKRDLAKAKTLTMTNCTFTNRLLGLEREIAHIDTVQFSLWTINKEGKKVKSYMYFPKASSLEYEGNEFRIIEGNDIISYLIKF